MEISVKENLQKLAGRHWSQVGNPESPHISLVGALWGAEDSKES